MYLVRDVFKTKAGRTKELVAKLRSASPHFENEGINDIRILTDVVGDFWTVIWEFEVDEISTYFKMSEHAIYSDQRVHSIMEGYQDHVLEGHREIFKLERM